MELIKKETKDDQSLATKKLGLFTNSRIGCFKNPIDKPILIKDLTCGYVMGDNFFSFSFSFVSLSSLKSNLVPTNIIGVLGQWCLTSGYH